jgi:phage shock protein PspC (stress-responsive transcriptional regulator)
VPPPAGGGEAPSTPPPPPTADPVGQRLLRRSRSDRVAAGVCGGLGDYFGLDPVIVRIIFVVLALFGGSGVLLYLIAWLVVAKEGDEETSVVRSFRGAPPDRRVLVAGLLVVAGILVLSTTMAWGPGFGFRDSLAMPLLLIAAGIAFLIWPENGLGTSSGDRSVEPETGPADRPVEPEAGPSVPPPAPEATGRWPHGYRRVSRDASPSSADVTAVLPPPPLPLPPPAEPPGRAFIGPLVLAILLLLTGGAVLAEAMDWMDVDVAVFLGACLMVIGTALVLSAFFGRARGLIVLGVFLLPVAWTVNALDLTWWDGTGEERITVANLAGLEDEYRYGIGHFVVDLSDLDLTVESRQLAVGLTIGQAVVYVPEDMHVYVDLDGRVGEIVINDGQKRVSDDGFDLSLSAELGDRQADGGLELDFDLGIGSARVEVCTDRDTAGLVACP